MIYLYPLLYGIVRFKKKHFQNIFGIFLCFELILIFKGAPLVLLALSRIERFKKFCKPLIWIVKQHDCNFATADSFILRNNNFWFII